MKNQTTNLMNKFFMEFLPSVVYHQDYGQDIIIDVITEGSAYVYNFVKTYFTKHNIICSYEEADFEVHFDLETYDEERFVRIKLPKGSSVLRAYIVFQVTTDGWDNIRYYFTLDEEQEPVMWVGHDGLVHPCRCNTFLGEAKDDEIVFLEYCSSILGYRVFKNTTTGTIRDLTSIMAKKGGWYIMNN